MFLRVRTIDSARDDVCSSPNFDWFRTKQILRFFFIILTHLMLSMVPHLSHSYGLGSFVTSVKITVRETKVRTIVRNNFETIPSHQIPHGYLDRAIIPNVMNYVTWGTARSKIEHVLLKFKIFNFDWLTWQICLRNGFVQSSSHPWIWHGVVTKQPRTTWMRGSHVSSSQFISMDKFHGLDHRQCSSIHWSTCDYAGGGPWCRSCGGTHSF